jgi:hypothetical protein
MLTFNALSRCIFGWCGIQVAADGSCGRTVLRADTRNDEGEPTGDLKLAVETQPYTIAMHLFRRNPNDPETLVIRGHTRGDAGTFEGRRRVYRYMVEFARVGDTTCRPKVS